MLQYANPAVVQLPFGTPEGLTLTRPSSSQIQIAPGRTLIRRASGARQLVILNAALTKSMSAAWAQGDNVGGRGSGVGFLTSTVYHVFLIVDANGAVDAYIDTSVSATGRPSGWDARIIGSFATGGSIAILDFDQQGDRFEYRGVISALDSSNLSTSSLGVITLLSPSVARAFGTIVTYRASGTANIFLSSEADPAPGAWCTAMPALNLQHYWQLNGNRMRIYADQISTTVAVRLRGFDHPRGANG
jgi:hypothetical protein